MSKYTMQLRYLCEMMAGLTESTGDYTAVINASYTKIIHPETAVYDPAYAPVLYKKILRHYYFDEIAHETAAQFIMRLNTKLDEILPYYNQLYASAALEFNPFYDVDYTRNGNSEDNNTIDRTRTDNLSALRTDDLSALRTDNLKSKRTDNLKSHSESLDWDTFSDTPEGSLTGVNNNSYLTSARKIDSEADGTNTGDQTMDNTGTQKTDNTGTQTNDDVIHNINEYFEHVVGKMGTTDYSTLLTRFRDTFLNIDMMIIEELHNLFMGVY